jgi:hypothetical protein
MNIDECFRSSDNIGSLTECFHTSQNTRPTVRTGSHPANNKADYQHSN